MTAALQLQHQNVTCSSWAVKSVGLLQISIFWVNRPQLSTVHNSRLGGLGSARAAVHCHVILLPYHMSSL